MHTKSTVDNRLLTKGELAEKLGLTQRGVQCLMARKAIPFFRISGKCVRFSWPAVQEALAKFEQKEGK